MDSRKPLNPNALPYVPLKYSDQRSIFLTFSNGFPLTERQIYDFFNWRYTALVEKVYVHRSRARGELPLFGRVTFTVPAVPDHVMGNKDKVCYVIDGLPLHCRRFVTKKTKTAAIANVPATTASNTRRGGGRHHGGNQ